MLSRLSGLANVVLCELSGYNAEQNMKALLEAELHQESGMELSNSIQGDALERLADAEKLVVELKDIIRQKDVQLWQKDEALQDDENEIPEEMKVEEIRSELQEKEKLISNLQAQIHQAQSEQALKMWKSVVGHNVSVSVETRGDDWDTDPDFVNDISEKEQRWGAKTIEGSGRTEHINIHQLRNKVSEEHDILKKKELESGPKASHGYGGRFGVERDRMDKSAVGHEYVADVEKHSSQTDAARGFGGKYGVERDRADKSAVGFDYKGEVEKHASQKDYSHGFGGRYGVEKDKRDKAALGYDYKGETEKHESQRDYAKGFGGQYGIQKDRVDKSAVGFNEMEAPTTAYKKTTPIEAASSGARGLKAKFESMAEEKRKREEEEKAQQMARQQQERKAVVKMSREAQQPLRPMEEPAVPAPVPAPLPKKISSEVWPPAESHPPPEPEPMRSRKEHPVPSLPRMQTPPQNPPEDEEPPALPPRTPEGLQVVEEPVYEAEPQQEPENDYEDVGELDQREEEEGDYEDVMEPECTPSLSYQAGSSVGAGGTGTSAVALYDYQGEGSDELSFDPDDIITDIEMVDEGWWRGRCHGYFGLFPANYVKLL